MLVPYEITIAKKGKWRTAYGDPYHIDDKKLDEYVRSYNPANYRAPLIFRHDNHGHSDVELNATKFAFGYPQRLRRVGDEVKAVFDRISPKVKQWINDGNVISLSPSFYRPDSPLNPTPGRSSLRHIALLGSEPPAITGMPLELKPTELAAFEDDDTCDSFTAQVHAEHGHLDFMMMGSALPQVLQRLREYFIAEKGTEEAEKILPAELLAQLTADSYFDPSQYQWNAITALQERIDSLQKTVDLLLKTELGDDDTPSFSQGGNVSETERNPRELELEAQLQKAREALAVQKRQASADFVRQQVERGAILPGEADDVTNLLVQLEKHPVELTAPDGTKPKPLAETLRLLLSSVEPRIVYDEVARGSGDVGKADSYDFQQAPGYEVNPGKKELHRKALVYQKQHPEVDIVAAYKAVGGQ